MKITSEHLTRLRDAIAPHDTDFHRSRYAASGLSTKRYQWDLLRHAGLMPWLCSDLYAYLNDDHIQTALNNVIKPLEDAT